MVKTSGTKGSNMEKYIKKKKKLEPSVKNQIEPTSIELVGLVQESKPITINF